MKKLLLTLSTCLLCGPALAQSNSSNVTVMVKKIEGFSESGDAFTFKTTTGKRYQIYNAGGTSPIQGEEYISTAVKTKKPICLRLSPNQTQPRMVEAVRQGKCN